MSYLVLARKWRPKTFQDLVGQTHVIDALNGAFERGRLHHAYLLTGTRGVGKTTIARILAKSFNCETGVTATPCGICSACEQIDTGRFPDMMEIDAASHTGVDNVREILDNAHYLPTLGRYKVYLIDEVHMLSKAAFNAMLKTLEEPPSHIKFILATTDPQKIPPTVLSRCLQFHLRPIQRSQIQSRCAYILTQEDIAFDEAGLTLLAQAAQGSLRDGLSLLDQAIAYGGGAVKESIVRSMLGVTDSSLCFDLLERLEQQNGEAVYALLQAIANETHNFESILDNLAEHLHRLALIQQVPSAAAHYPQETERLLALSQRLSPETVQLFYQIVLHGKRDLGLAPDALAGLSMTLFRMLSFRPVQPTHTTTPPQGALKALQIPSTTTANSIPTKHSQPPVTAPQAPPLPFALPITTPQPAPTQAVAPQIDNIPSPSSQKWPDSNEAWQALIPLVKTSPMVRQLLLHSAWRNYQNNELFLTLAQEHKHLLIFQKELSAAIGKLYPTPIQINIDALETMPLVSSTDIDTLSHPVTLDTPAQRMKLAEQETHQQRVDTFKNDPFIHALSTQFDATVDERTVRPIPTTPH